MLFIILEPSASHPSLSIISSHWSHLSWNSVHFHALKSFSLLLLQIHSSYPLSVLDCCGFYTLHLHPVQSGGELGFASIVSIYSKLTFHYVSSHMINNAITKLLTPKPSSPRTTMRFSESGDLKESKYIIRNKF